jgi:hypothetical protein
MNENSTNTNETTVDEYNGATVTLPLEKFVKIVSECVAAKTRNDELSTKYWLLHAENESLKKKLEEMGREP